MYQVALAEIFFDDPELSSEPHKYFNTSETNRDNEIKVFDTQGVAVSVVKQHHDLEKWMKDLENGFENLSLGGINLRLKMSKQTDLVSGDLIAKMEFIDPDSRFKLIIPEKYSTILGFKETEFLAGTYYSDTFISLEKFDDIGLDENVIFRCLDTVAKIVKIGEPVNRTPSALAAKIVTEFIKHGYLITMPKNENNQMIVMIKQKNLSFQLPEIANKAFGLPPNFVFTDEQTLVNLNLPLERIESDKLPSKQVLVSSYLIEGQVFGEKSMPILRIFQRPETKGYHHVVFQPLYYFNLKYSELKNIHIRLTGENGYLLPHSQNPTTVVLHFRRKTL